MQLDLCNIVRPKVEKLTHDAEKGSSARLPPLCSRAPHTFFGRKASMLPICPFCPTKTLGHGPLPYQLGLCMDHPCRFPSSGTQTLAAAPEETRAREPSRSPAFAERTPQAHRRAASGMVMGLVENATSVVDPAATVTVAIAVVSSPPQAGSCVLLQCGEDSEYVWWLLRGVSRAAGGGRRAVACIPHHAH
jgi:hypothetical protein